MENGHPVKHETEIAPVLQALAKVHGIMDDLDADRRLHHLVWLRASQINGCAFCVKMHTREAREDGESSERLDRLVVWRHVDDFDAREKAAFAWTEALTLPDPKDDLSALRATLRQHMSDREIGLLTSAIAMINLWNRMQLATH